MPNKKTYQQTIRANDNEIHMFVNAEEVWFWFIRANEASQNGAKIISGQGLYNRPCEPLDILCVLNGLYRKHRLTMEHLRVMKHYGSRMLPPDANRPREISAQRLWNEAMQRIEPTLVKKGIVCDNQKKPSFWDVHTGSHHNDNKYQAIS